MFCLAKMLLYSPEMKVFFVFLVIAFLSSKAFPAQTVTETLALNQPLEKTIKPKETHTYSLLLQNNQLVQILVKQQGADVKLLLFDESGKPLSERDNRNTLATDEKMSFIAKANGKYRLEIQAEGNMSGRYQIALTQLRAAKSEDEFLVAAEKALMQGRNSTGDILAEARRTAVERFKEAVELYLKAGDKTGANVALYNLGQEYSILGERKTALAVYEQALKIEREIKNRSGEAKALRLICVTHHLLNENQKALNVCSESLKIQREIKVRDMESASLYQLLGELNSYLGNTEASLDYYEQAYAIAREIGARFIEVRILNQIATTHFESENYDEALKYLRTAIQAQENYFGSVRVRRTTSLLGNIYVKLGQPEKALPYFNELLEQGRRSGGLTILSNALESLGELYYETGDYKKALEHLREALTIRQSVFNRSSEANIRYQIALTLRKQGDLKNALGEIEEVIDIIESMRAQLVEQEIRASYFSTAERYYDFYLDLLWQLHCDQPKAGYDAKALQISERVHARGLVEILNETQADIRQGVPKDLLERERALQQRLNARAEAQMNLLNGRHTPEQKEAIAKELQEVLEAYSEVKAQIKMASPRYAALTEPVALTLPEIQKTLDENTLLLEYKLGKERSFLWAITEKSFAAYELPNREEVETQARSVYELLTARNQFPNNETDKERQARLAKAENEYAEAAAKLSQTLFSPIASQLKNQRLLIVADGTLQYIPFAALSAVSSQQSAVNTENKNSEQRTADGGQFLIANHEIVRLPSASVISVLRRELANRPMPKKAVAIFADPVFTKEDSRLNAKKKELLPSQQRRLRDFESRNEPVAFLSLNETKEDKQIDISRLPFSRREAIAIQTTASPDETFVALDFNANRARATSPELAQYRIIHFATHGWLDSRHPELSGLILSLVNERGAPQDGFLRLHEIYNLELNAGLVVLSACQTALGKEVRGEGLIGLTRGFMYAGAARVAASLWKVDDAATAELMSRFYYFMLREKMSPSAALRAAQLELMKQKRWSAPYFWASFVLQGEWR